MSIEYKTSEEWQNLYPNVKVLDPDGWDRMNFQYSWYEELITFAEYEYRLMGSTCKGYTSDWKTKQQTK